MVDQILQWQCPLIRSDCRGISLFVYGGSFDEVPRHKRRKDANTRAIAAITRLLGV
jgi:hypothetical protein